MKKDLCFGGLALGREYRFYTRELAIDLEYFAPDVPLVVFTDVPEEFADHRNVIAIKHAQRSVIRCFHDIRFVLDHALEEFKTCIAINTNVRIVEPLPMDFAKALKPGIVALACEKLENHLRYELDDPAAWQRKSVVGVDRQVELVKLACQKLGVSLSETDYVFEIIYAVSCEGEQKKKFIDTWGKLANFFEYHGMTWGEGFAAGIAAKVAGLPVCQNVFIPEPSYYKHRDYIDWERKGRVQNQRLTICHRQRLLLQSYARFTLFPRAVHARLDKLRTLLRFAWFKLTTKKGDLI